MVHDSLDCIYCLNNRNQNPVQFGIGHPLRSWLGEAITQHTLLVVLSTLPSDYIFERIKGQII